MGEVEELEFEELPGKAFRATLGPALLEYEPPVLPIRGIKIGEVAVGMKEVGCFEAVQEGQRGQKFGFVESQKRKSYVAY